MVRIAYSNEALANKVNDRTKLNAEIGKVEDAIAQKRSADEKIDRQKPTIRAAKFGWSADDLRKIEAEFAESQLTQNEIAKLRDAELHSPPIPDLPTRQALKLSDDGKGERAMIWKPNARERHQRVLDIMRK